MKSTIYRLLTFVLFSVCFIACSDEDYTKNTTNESLEQSIKIRLSLQSEKTQTRAIDHILSDDNEEAITSLQLFIFRRDGERMLVKDYYFPQWADKKIIEAYTGRFIYVFVANQFQEWTGITKYGDLANKLYTIIDESDISKNKALVAVFNKELLIPYPAPGSDIVELKDGTEPISLTRLCSKVLLNLKIEGTTSDQKPLSDKLNIKSVQMKNASSAMYIFNENAPLDEHTTPSIDYPVRLFNANNELNTIDDAFYILERKAHDKLQLGTYVEIVAEYRDINSEVPTKLITYCARFNTAPFEGNKYTGLFNVSRNQKYLLNVKITGTNDDDIRVDIEDLQKDGVFVSCNATGRSTGANWEDAFTTINEAIAFVTEYNKNNSQAPLTSIHVKEGTYRESIHIPDGITIAGGFAGNLMGTNISDRNYSIKPILKSEGNNQPSSVVTFPATLTQPSALCYFIIEDGQAPMGGGVNMQSKHAILQACRVRNNKGEQGGGIYLSGGQVWNCIIDNNEASTNGAGIYIPNNATDAHIQNATIVANKWSGAIPTVAKGTLFNIPSSGIYAASGAAATAHSCILYHNADENNVPSGVNYKFCAFSTDELLTWDQISNANIRIVSSNNVPSNQPFVTEVTNPGFKDETSFELSETSPLLSRGYVGKNKPDWNHTDYNGIQATNKKFPNIGATQGPAFRPYLDMYIKKRSFLPSIGSSIAAFIASNVVENRFNSGTLRWSVQPFIADYYTTMPLETKVSNNSKQENTLEGNFSNSVAPRTFSIPQAYMNFEILKNNIIHNLDRNLYLMPTGSENSASYELFTHNPVQYIVNTKIATNERSFKSFANNKATWLSATETNDVISFHNKAYTLPVNQVNNHSTKQVDLEFQYSFIDSEITLAIKPFSKNNFIQVPEWILGGNTTISVLGLTETHLQDYFATEALPTWQFDAARLLETTVDDGKTNTASAINQILDANDYEWDASDESNYKSTLSNAFIFCASLDPAVRQKLISKTKITAQDLSWYIPSINELKFITIFDNDALQFSTKEYYYITSTFSDHFLRRFHLEFYNEWKADASTMHPGYIRCIRNTNATAPTNTLYGGVAIVDSLGSYIVRSEGMYSQSILSGLPLSPSPNEDELAAKFQVYPKENTEIYNYNEAQKYCDDLPADEHGTWRIPTMKEMMLIHLSQKMMPVNEKFEPLLKLGSYFILQEQITSDTKVFELKNGTVEKYFEASGLVRCVRSIK